MPSQLKTITQQPGQKQQKWLEITKEVDSLTDVLGKPVDVGVRDLVIALRVWGFPTAASCEGHIGWGELYPWIRINVVEAENAATPVQDKTRREEWRQQNLTYAKQMIELLAQFYKSRNVPYEVQLNLSYMGWGQFFLQSVGSEVLSLFSSDIQTKSVVLFRQEMTDFTLFLKNKWVAKE